MPNREVKIRASRRDYSRFELLESKVAVNPFKQLSKWLDEAIKAKLWEPNAMSLSTCGKNLKPTARMVLLKEFDEQGLVFYTNYLSRKGKQIVENKNAALLFWWGPLERQVRIEGKLRFVSAAESDAYFRTRPRSAQIGASISPQSTVIPNRKFLEALLVEQEKKFKNTLVVRPSTWGGYRLVPNRFEFWQGRKSRLHDRIEFVLAKSGVWKRQRLAP